jgi:hypothetical protein
MYCFTALCCHMPVLLYRGCVVSPCCVIAHYTQQLHCIACCMQQLHCATCGPNSAAAAGMLCGRFQGCPKKISVGANPPPPPTPSPLAPPPPPPPRRPPFPSRPFFSPMAVRHPCPYSFLSLSFFEVVVVVPTIPNTFRWCGAPW